MTICLVVWNSFYFSIWNGHPNFHVVQRGGSTTKQRIISQRFITVNSPLINHCPLEPNIDVLYRYFPSSTFFWPWAPKSTSLQGLEGTALPNIGKVFLKILHLFKWLDHIDTKEQWYIYICNYIYIYMYLYIYI